jgi:lipopolysaccharide/colanic/teichoic acid biosynthesis glycosyltransferase
LRIKGALDAVVGALLVALLAPILVLIGVGIRIVDGKPALFRQVRSGRDERPFKMWKFRTMVVDADSLLDEHGRPTRDRITKTGKYLRATSLDELPNLLNIAKGDMAFVGPRPTLPEMRDAYGLDDDLRFAVKPGLTGLAQVSGRNSIPWRERLRLDTEYVRNYSLALDVKILLRTVRVVILREGVQLDRNPDANLEPRQ